MATERKHVGLQNTIKWWSFQWGIS